ncbi:hypothetical protein MAR_015345 [Mya arenaria]|uniref:RING-type domain-containing protein n=1 Tax=Mya arenaria TaxID=6604 RepID=A0ABY7FQA0_MYAAR|nr:uncharacterized protein LOC128212339 [Mya arenaria]WAR21371.1 hypothetical protein MAR_015345 [Mya arenaria]
MPYKQEVPDIVLNKLTKLSRHKFASLVETFKHEYLLELKYPGKGRNIELVGTNKDIVGLGMDELRASVGLSSRFQLSPRLEAGGRVLWTFRRPEAALVPALFREELKEIRDVKSIFIREKHVGEVYEVECNQRDFAKVNAVVEDIQTKIQQLQSVEIQTEVATQRLAEEFRRKYRRHPLFQITTGGQMVKRFGENDQSILVKGAEKMVIHARQERYLDMGHHRWEEFVSTHTGRVGRRLRRKADPRALPADLVLKIRHKPGCETVIQTLVERDFILGFHMKKVGKRIKYIRISGNDDSILSLAVDGIRYFVNGSKEERKQFLWKFGKVVTVYHGREAENVKHLFRSKLHEIKNVNPSVTVGEEWKDLLDIKCPHQFFDKVNKIIKVIEIDLASCVSDRLVLQSPSEEDLIRKFVRWSVVDRWYCHKGKETDGQMAAIDFHGRNSEFLLEGKTAWTTFKMNPDTGRSDGPDGTPRSDRPPEGLHCPLCRKTFIQLLSSGERLVAAPCGHVFCRKCVEPRIELNRKCPQGCRPLVAPRDLLELRLTMDAGDKTPRRKQNVEGSTYNVNKLFQ